MPADASFETPIALMLPATHRCTFSMALDPVLTVHALITGAITGALGTDSQLRSVVIEALGNDGFTLYSHIRVSHDRVFYPRLIVPYIDTSSRWGVHAREAIADRADDDLIEELSDMQRLRDGHGWDTVIANPRPWLDGIASAFARVADAITPWWTRASHRLAIEEARLEMVGTTPEGVRHFVNELSPSVRLDADALRVKWTELSPELAGDQIVLTPMVVPRLNSYLVLKTPVGTAYGYPMAAALRASARTPTDRLEALLGQHRAQILRHLDRPRTHTEVAAGIGIALSTTNHHVEKLRSSGLVVTMQLGRSHWLRRTAVGEALLNMLD